MAAHRIEVGFKPGVRDALGEGIAKRVAEELAVEVKSVKTIDVYTIDEENITKVHDSQNRLDARKLDFLAKEVFADLIVNDFSVDAPLARNGDFDFAIEVGFRPGVTDNVGKTATAAVRDALGPDFAGTVYFSKQYLLSGVHSQQGAEGIAKGLLANPLIERWTVKSPSEWGEAGMGVFIPAVQLVQTTHSGQEEINLGVGEGELAQISKQRLLALSLGEMKAIRGHFSSSEVRLQRVAVGVGENPTEAELEVFGQTWSEHCKHKIFNALVEYGDESGVVTKIDSLFKTFVRGATEAAKKDWLASVFSDNAGIVSFNDDWNVAIKVETHNAPSALEPYGGALTGIGGVNRDLLGAGLGAKLLFNTDVFCFAPPGTKVPPGVLSPKRIFEGVRKGVQDGGNKTGVPTVNGCIVFDGKFAFRPLVYCGTGGLMPKFTKAGAPSHEKAVKDGDLIVMTGGRVGKDGIHGATFSSMQIDPDSPASAVQLGDPITLKKMADFILEARDAGLYAAITDNGAGGLSSSVGEMAQLSGGFEMHLERVPLKYPGLAPWEILVSESQDRMTLAVPPSKLGELMALAAKHEVEATALGKFTSSGKFHCLHDGRTIAYLDMEFLHHGVPQLRITAKWTPPMLEEPVIALPFDYASILSQMLSRLNICSKERVIRQYDHEVQGGSAVKPLAGVANDGPSDAAVLRPLLSSNEGLVVANGICPKFSQIDAYWMAANAVDEAVRNYACAGGDFGRVCGLDNFSWCDPLPSATNPDAEFKMAQLVRACTGLRDACAAYSMPLVSGKDSMKNDYVFPDGRRESIPPTLLVTAMGKISDVSKAVTMDAKSDGNLVYALGTTSNELGGSEYYAMQGFVGANVPKVDFPTARRLYLSLGRAMGAGLVASCHDCSDGGLAVALAESAFAGGLGMEIELAKVPVAGGVARDDVVLFSESASRFVVTVKPGHALEFERAMAGNAFAKIGEVVAQDNFSIAGLQGSKVADCSIAALKESWQAPLR
ncbi:phosphoribosylformylglycinamidine synthase subunit PurL [Candidatus Micrarchaeota archaeon]|nr:phosphoribosylformylglycinamidine synthase subunit PurL [Candidatus Micrarchaeota archaeon]